MQKDFDRWNKQKKEVHYKNNSKFYNSREIWWCALGVNVGLEEDGRNIDYKRPVLIIKGLSRDTCIIVPLTTSKENHKYRPSVGKIDEKEAKVVLSQIRVIDTKRLLARITLLDREVFEDIRKTIRSLF